MVNKPEWIEKKSRKKWWKNRKDTAENIIANLEKWPLSKEELNLVMQKIWADFLTAQTIVQKDIMFADLIKVLLARWNISDNDMLKITIEAAGLDIRQVETDNIWTKKIIFFTLIESLLRNKKPLPTSYWIRLNQIASKKISLSRHEIEWYRSYRISRIPTFFVVADPKRKNEVIWNVEKVIICPSKVFEKNRTNLINMYIKLILKKDDNKEKNRQNLKYILCEGISISTTLAAEKQIEYLKDILKSVAIDIWLNNIEDIKKNNKTKWNLIFWNEFINYFFSVMDEETGEIIKKYLKENLLPEYYSKTNIL